MHAGQWMNILLLYVSFHLLMDIRVHFLCCGVCLVAQACPTLCDPVDCNLPDFPVHGDSPGKNTEVGCHAVIQGIFPTQVSHTAGGFFNSRATREAQEHWSGCTIPSPGELLTQRWKRDLLHCRRYSLLAEIPGKITFISLPVESTMKENMLI